MSTIEDRVHSAIRETAGEITPGSVPPLALPARARTSLARPLGRLQPRPGWRRTAAPLAAAAAVIAVIAGSVALTRSDRPGVPAPGPGQAAARTVALATAPVPAGALAGIPAYYVGLTGYQGEKHLSAVVRASATGAALARVAVPLGYSSFTRVSGAADDLTFALSAQRPAGDGSAPAKGTAGPQVETFFLLRLSPSAHTARLTQLPVPVVPGSDGNGDAPGLGGIALSPDGGKLAMTVDRPAPLAPEIRVADTATGAQRTWQWNGPGWLDDHKGTIFPLSWAGDGRTLAFQQGQDFTTTGARLLNTQAPGSNLRSASRLAAQWQFAQDRTGNIAITRDGSKIVAPVTVVTKKPSRSYLRITEFSTRTGKVQRVAAQWVTKGSEGGQDVMWSNPSGSKLIVEGPDARPSSGKVLVNPNWTVGLLSGGHFTPLPHAFAHNTDYLTW